MNTQTLKAVHYEIMRLTELLGEASSNIREAIHDCDEHDNYVGATIVIDDAIHRLSELDEIACDMVTMLFKWNQSVSNAHEP